MKWKTAISTKKDGDVFVRGEALSELIANVTFADAAFLLLRGTMPSEHETRMFNAMLVACVEHGVEPPSAFMARTAASVGNDTNVSIAAGVLAISNHHGGAIENAMRILQTDEDSPALVKRALAEKWFIPGLGHKIYKDSDPRAEQLFSIAGECGVSGAHCEKMRALQKELTEQSGTKLPVNIDGAIAAILSDMGFDHGLGKAFFILGRLPGIIAHAHEERTKEKPYRRIDPEDVTYTGPQV